METIEFLPHPTPAGTQIVVTTRRWFRRRVVRRVECLSAHAWGMLPDFTLLRELGQRAPLVVTDTALHVRICQAYQARNFPP